MLSIRWLYSTNAKDIGTFYLVFAIFAALVGLSFSLIIRLELTTPGVGILNQDAQLYNAVVTAHALAMIFFFVIPASVGGFGDYIIAVLLAIITYYVTICGEVYKTLLTKVKCNV